MAGKTGLTRCQQGRAEQLRSPSQPLASIVVRRRVTSSTRT